jgi:nitrogen fixation protein FixH
MTANNSPWRNPWIIGWISLIVVVLLANAVMALLAVSTNPGLVTDEYYSAGRTLEKTTLSRRAKRAEHEIAFNVPELLYTAVPATFRVVGVDQVGVPIKADSVVFQAYRPSDKNADFELPMQPEGAGRFRAEVAFPLKGIWDIVVSFRQGDEEIHTARRVTVAAR